ncbi:MAG TPA: AraC family ligand binding domain-containing protein, partial [Candidatus Methylacidiphilales bacterium]|nr:AraC family ligand binding domain-containing protein [Candidatus Methylacidiphilales bacterium]
MDVEPLKRNWWLPLNDIAVRVLRMVNHRPGTRQHSHDFEELVVVTEGSGTHWVGDQRYRIGPGDVFVILGDTRHCYQDTQNLGLIN